MVALLNSYLKIQVDELLLKIPNILLTEFEPSEPILMTNTFKLEEDFSYVIL